MNPRFGFIGAIVLSLIIAGYLLYPEDVVRQNDGILCPEIPVQKSVAGAEPIIVDDFTITPLAEFKLHGRVLSKKEYSWGTEADLSPADLAMGWMEMSDQRVVDMLEISQGSRWYRWKPVEAFPIPRRTIEQCSANMHIIPADDVVRNTLDDVCEGNIILFEGYLVKITKQDGWHWSSSLSRDDVGNGACEVVYVTDMAIEI